MCTLTRTFHPVGQGLFCTEKFFCSDSKPVNLVYDCGSLRGLCKVRNSIIQTFAPKEEIEAVYISHFDADHVNGLPFLLARCKVKNLYLPFIASELELAFKRASLHKENKKNIDVLDRLLSMRDNGEYAIGDTRKTNVVIVRPQDDELSGGTVKRPHQTISVGEDKWLCCSYNYDSIARRSIYDNAVAAILKNWGIAEADFINNPQGIIQGLGDVRARRLLKNMRDQLLSDFSAANAGDVNSNSMLLYSGPEIDSVGSWNKISYCGKINMKGGYKTVSKALSSTCDNVGCLYFGDYNAFDANAWSAMYEFYSGKSLWNEIGCVQIPHHGSRKSFSGNFVNMADVCFAVSYGVRNKFGHPGSHELATLRNGGKLVYEVTEHSPFRGMTTHK